MDVDLVPAVATPPSNNPPFAPIVISDVAPLSLSDPDIATSPQQPESPIAQTESPEDPADFSGAVAVEGTFDIKGVHGSFINKTTVRYWKGIPGGEKWISMVRSYIDLERMIPTDAVRDSLFNSVVIINLFPVVAFISLYKTTAARGSKLVERPKVLEEGYTHGQ